MIIITSVWLIDGVTYRWVMLVIWMGLTTWHLESLTSHMAHKWHSSCKKVKPTLSSRGSRVLIACKTYRNDLLGPFVYKLTDISLSISQFIDTILKGHTSQFHPMIHLNFNINMLTDFQTWVLQTSHSLNECYLSWSLRWSSLSSDINNVRQEAKSGQSPGKLSYL